MAIALVSSGGGVPGTTVLDTTGANLIVLALAADAATGPSDNKGNTWTGLTAQGSATVCRLFYCLNPSVGTGHIFTGAVGYGAIFAAAFSGVKTSGAFDAETGSTGSSVSTLAAGPITPSENNCLVVAGLSIGNSAATISAGGGMTLQAALNAVSGVSFGGAIAYKVQTDAAAITPSFTWTGATSAEVCVAVFKSTDSSLADTTPPTLTGSIAITSLTSTGYTATCPVATDNVAVTGYQWRLGGGGAYTDISAGGRAFTFTGRTPSSTDALEMRAKDAANNFSTALSAVVNLPASGDSTVPVLTGVVTPSAIGTTSATISWPVGTDNVAVTGYEYSLNGAAYANAGNVLFKNLTGLTPDTEYTASVRAFDAAGNRSTPAITGSFTTLETFDGGYSAQFGPGFYATGSGPQLAKSARWYVWPGSDDSVIGTTLPITGSGVCDSNGRWTVTGIEAAGPVTVLAVDADGGVYFDRVTAG